MTDDRSNDGARDEGGDPPLNEELGPVPRTGPQPLLIPHKGGEGIDAAAAAAPEPGCRIIANKNRRAQVAPTSRRLFDEAAKAEFLEWFAATCNCSLSARKTGFHYRTVIRHWREDEAFGERCEAALKMGYPRLEELALRAAAEALDPERRRPPKGDRTPPDEHFQMDPMTALQLLREHQRQLAGLPGGSGRGAKPGPPLKRWSFEEAIVALDQRLRALGLRHGIESEPIESPLTGPTGGRPDAGPEEDSAG